MPRAVILHGTGGSPAENWFPWLSEQLKARGYDVWVPQLPDADTPDAQKWTDFLLQNGGDFSDSLLIGHSAGSVEILQLLQRLSVTVKAAVLTAAFSELLVHEPDWQQLRGLFEPGLDFAKIGSRAKIFSFVHAVDDPYCDPVQARTLAKQLHGNYVELPDGQHFSASLDPTYTAFPQLISIMEDQKIL